MQYSVLSLCQKYNQKIPIHEYLEEVFFEANSFITHIVVYSSFLHCCWILMEQYEGDDETYR